MGENLTKTEFARVFWTIVGLSGFAGIAAGAIVERIGIMPAMKLFLFAIALSATMISLSKGVFLILLSGIIFGGFFVLLAGTLGMWSMDLFPDFPALGFGSVFLLLSAGQFVGPLLVGLFIDQIQLSTMFLGSAFFCVMLMAILNNGAIQTEPLR